MYTAEMARGEHRIAHALFTTHINTCRRCSATVGVTGNWCREGQALERAADVAGNRWEAIES